MGGWRQLPVPVRVWLVRGGLALLLFAQSFVAFHELGNDWQHGHNGFNGAAYHLAARNTLRWGTFFPVQYYVGTMRPPQPNEMYTHAPMALHVLVTASVAVFGDHEASVRLVPALTAVFTMFALVFVVRRRWGDGHALLAGFLFLVAPLNSVFANMVNHSNGFFACALLAWHAYLTVAASAQPKRRDIALTLGWVFAGLMWDWPMYYVGALMGVHWIYTAARHRNWRHGVGVVLLAVVGIGSMATHFGLAAAIVGDLGEMQASAGMRSTHSWESWKHIWENRLAPIFPVTLIAPALVGAVLGISRKEIRWLIPCSFLLAGAAHTLLFPHSLHVHIYWSWPLLPGLVIAAAAGLVAMAQALAQNRRGQAAAAALVLVFVAHLAYHGALLAIEGRRVAGDLFLPTAYKARLAKTRFLGFVRSQTERDTSVLPMPRMRFRPEQTTTLDRPWVSARTLNQGCGKSGSFKTGNCVIVGRIRRVSERHRLEAAARHYYVEVGEFFMVDYRKPGEPPSVLKAKERAFSPWDWYWRSAHYPQTDFVPDADSQAKFEAKVKAKKKKNTPRSKTEPSNRWPVYGPPNPKDTAIPSKRGKRAKKKPTKPVLGPSKRHILKTGPGPKKAPGQ